MPEHKVLESVICDVIKIRLKRSIVTRSGKGNKPLNIKTDVELPTLKLGLPNFRLSFYFILLLLASLLFRRLFMTSHMAVFLSNLSHYFMFIKEIPRLFLRYSVVLRLWNIMRIWWNAVVKKHRPDHHLWHFLELFYIRI